MSPEQRRRIVSAMVKKGVPTVRIASRIGVPISIVRSDRLILSAPNPDEIVNTEPEKPVAPRSVSGASYMETSVRQHHVARKFRDGLNDKEIAHDLGISIMTVSRDRSRLGLTREPVETAVNIRRAKVKALIEKGATSKEVGVELGISKVMVSRDRAALGYGPGNQGKSQEIADRRAKVRAMIEAGGSYKGIASELDASPMTIHRDCEAMGISSSSSKDSLPAKVDARRAAVRKAHKKNLKVSEIASLLEVSQMTVRRDIETLGLE